MHESKGIGEDTHTLTCCYSNCAMFKKTVGRAVIVVGKLFAEVFLFLR